MQAFAPYQRRDSVSPTLSVIKPEADASAQTPHQPKIGAEEGIASRAIYLTGVPTSTVLMTLNQLAVMTQNGVELAEALGHAKQQCSDSRLKQTLNAIHHAVGGGSTFSSAVATYGTHLPPILPTMLAAAEATGNVPETLGRLCKRMRGELEMRGAIVGAMIYPAILMAAAALVMSALILGVLPQFGRVFESMGRPVPATTQLLIDIGRFGQSNWYYLLAAMVGTVVPLFAFRKHSWVSVGFGSVLLYAPMVKDAYRPLLAGRTFRNLSSMVSGGVPLLQAVQLTRRTVTNRLWNQLLGRIEQNLIDGSSASAAMTGVDFLPNEATQMMATAERTGRVAEVLEDIGKYYEEEGGRRIKRLVVALEPVIILAMGIVVAGVVMSVMLPLLDVSTIQR